MDISKEEMDLIKWAFIAAKKAYSPYSHFCVGAALLTAENGIYLGCNIENSSYGATNCAERTAIFKAVSDGIKSFKAIAVVGYLEGNEPTDFAYPCGICRQVMSEFCEPDFKIIVAKAQDDYKVFTLSELLPQSFGADNVK